MTVIKELAIKLLSPYRYESIKIDIKSLINCPPILVYQMGKVGSTTVYNSLKEANIENPVYHLHSLSLDKLNKEAELCDRQKIPLYGEIKIGKILSKKIKEGKPIPWKIITLVREPIGNQISHIFQQPFLFNPDLLDRDNRIENSHAIEFIRAKLENFDPERDYIATWFDKELKAMLGINIYDRPFDRHKGFTIFRQENFEILVLRLEDLNKNFDEAITQFLSLENPIKMSHSNIRKNKKYSNTYKYVLENIKISRLACENIYSSKYARHFYEEDRIEKLIKKWSGEGKEETNFQESDRNR